MASTTAVKAHIGSAAGAARLTDARDGCDSRPVAVSGGSVYFHATSTTMTAAQFSERIGIEPTHAAEIGDLVGNSRFGRRYEFAIWTLERDLDDGALEPLDDALLSLLSTFDGREAVLDELRTAFDFRVQCWGSSDSPQGGFWLSPQVLQRLGQLGADLICTVYLDEAPIDR